MTILKKLSVAIVLALGIQSSAGAFFNATETEKTDILRFAQDIRQQNSIQAQNVAAWLENKVINAHDLTTIANIIANNDLSTKSKLTIFSASMKQEISAKKWQTCIDTAAALVTGTLFVGMCTLATWAIIEDIRNPRPFVVYKRQEEPSISVTWRTRR